MKPPNETDYKMKILFLILPFLCISQVKINDPVYAIGILNEDTSAGKLTDDFCDFKPQIDLYKNEPLLLTGVLNCDKYVSIKFFEVYCNGEKYLINQEYVTTTDETKERLTLMDTITKSKIVEMSKSFSVKMEEEALKEANKYLVGAKANGIAIKDWSFYDESDYTSGTGYSISFRNLEKKTIKYVTLTLKALNPVNDLVGIKSVKCVGPIKQNETGKYDFNYVWHSDLVDTVILTGIKIQYMDGSFKTAPKPKNSFLNKRCYNLLFHEENLDD